MLKQFVKFLFLIISLDAASAEWVEVMKFEDRSEYVDLSSLSIVNNGIRNVWVKSGYKTIQHDKELNTRYDTYKSFYALDCNENKIALKAVVMSLNNNAVLSESLPENEKLRFIDAPPDSIGEVLLDLCKK